MSQRGDTIIEVLLATVVISVVIAGAYTLTNRATRINQTAFERTIVTNYMQAQIEKARAARIFSSGDSGLWRDVLDKETSTAPDYSGCNPGSEAFYIDGDTVMGFSGSPNFDGLYRIWLEAYAPTTDYIDIHVRACWQGIGGEAEQRSALVMRMAS
jgi:type II secretory pathway pseudopilin PulG